MSDDDKTRINLPGVTSNSKSDKNALSDDGDKTRMSNGEEKRRLDAQKKARELEKRLAAISAKKKSKLQKPDSVAPVNSDKTQFDPRNRSEDSSAREDDKTRIQDKPLAPSVSDKTRTQSRDDSLGIVDSFEGGSDTGDKTTFKPKKAAGKSAAPSDETAISELPIPAPKAGAGSELDRSQYLKDGHELLKNRFVFEEVLGAGGMGVVYKAKDLLKVEAQDKNPYVAIKVLSDDFKTHPEAFIALQRESRKTQSIAHPNIVNVYDFDRDGETVFMTMEYLDGSPLDALISRYKTTGLPEEDAWKVLEGISAALIHAHAQKIIHSDFKPGNIFVVGNNIGKVFDFGIARAVAKAEVFEESVDDKTVFDAGNLGALTPAYASLEMLEGKTPDVRDDIFALGCIAYEMFTGCHPYNRVHADEAMRQKIKPKRIPNITKRQWKVIEKALAFKREDRIESVAEFWRQLTHKKSSGVLIAGVLMVLLTAGSILTYQNYFGPKENTFSEDDIRSEIERKLFIEQNKRELEELLLSLEFTSSWERKLANTVSNLEKLLGKESLWLPEQRLRVFNVYFDQVISLIASEEFDRARAILKSASNYSDEEEKLAVILKQIDEAQKFVAIRKEKERKAKHKTASQKQEIAKKNKVQKEKNEAFDVALKTVTNQLQCRSSMNIRDVNIAITKLRSLNPGRYRKAENTIVKSLSACIRKIGRSFPERAEEFKKRALRIFPGNKVVARIKIEPKDPCDKSLAGLGARGSRAICRDTLKSEGESFGKGPALVVIPEKGSLKTFAIGKYEVTIGDFNRFCEHSEKCSVREGRSSKMPITKVDVELFNQYLDWLSRKSKRAYRLPTKSEWVYAARANSSKLDSNRNCRLDSRGIKKGGVLIKASSGQQNAWGLINYLGNARELVYDRDEYFVLGGSYETAIEECVVTKSVDHSGKADKYTGYRVLREIDLRD